MTIPAPFPWFGGKTRAASLIWERLGDVPNYIEPFAGSLAVLLSRPGAPGIETVNDKDRYLANLWRAIAADPEAVACYADRPVNECDLYAIHRWLVNTGAERIQRMEDDPDYYDAQVAGWWLWGICQWIGSGWCSAAHTRKRPHLGNAGKGVHRQLPHLGDAGMDGAAYEAEPAILPWLMALQARLRRVRVCCGDWSRVLGPSVTEKHGLTGIVLDPPYDLALRDAGCYAVDAEGLSGEVRAWAIANGENPRLRIVLCGYDGEHAMPDGWECVVWNANGGYGNQVKAGRGRDNAAKERLWFSPHCLRPGLFGDADFGSVGKG